MGLVQVGHGSGIGLDRLTRRSPCGGGELAGGGPNTKRGQIIPRHRSRECGVEGGGGNSHWSFTASTTYHDSLHGLRAGLGTRNSTLEVKPIQQVIAMREEVLHTILLDLHKAYNALDRSR